MNPTTHLKITRDAIVDCLLVDAMGLSAAIAEYEISHVNDVPHNRLDAHRCPPHPGLDYYDNRHPRREGSE